MYGLTGLELRMAYQSLISVESSLKTTNDSDDLQPQENLIPFDLDFEETPTKILEMMRSKLDGPQVRRIPLANTTLSSLTFPGITEEDLSKLNITYGGSLKLKTDYKVRVAATGTRKVWALVFRGALRVLQKLIPSVNEAASLAWINSSSSAHVQWCNKASSWCPVSQSVQATTVKPPSFTTLGGYN